MISEIYQVFAAEAAGLEFACGPGCATCCTRSVTLTTAEGRLIVDYLRENGRVLPELPRDRLVLRPALTTNGLASFCLAGREAPPEAASPWLFEPCFFLREGLCCIYPVRPFACRSFGSTVNCRASGMAELPDRLITVAIVTNQLLEALDRGGYWGNLADILAFLAAPAGQQLPVRERLLPNLPAPGLLVAPAERGLVEGYLNRVAEVTGLDLAVLGFRRAQAK